MCCDKAWFLAGIRLPSWITKQKVALQLGMLNEREIEALHILLTREFKIRTEIPLKCGSQENN